MQYTLAGIQSVATDDPERNLKHVVQLAQIAATRGATIVLLPQLCTTPWFPAKVNGGVPLRSHEDALQRLRECAQAHGIHLVAPMPERPQGDRDEWFNSAFVIGQDGELIGTYRKRYLPDLDGYREKAYFSPGTGPLPVFDLAGLRLGVQICWDNYFPEGARILALAGAQLIFAPTAAAFDSQQRWRALLCSHALCNNLYVFRLNRAGSEGTMEFYGQSFCVDPFGELVAEPAGPSEAIVMATIDTDQVDEARRITRFLADRQPELYAPLAAPTGG
ncbi:MAG: nitrilase-related carbon-nitrogen hydrolase [Nitrospirota bacterium]|jgi:N-carbamoylputrescine amidase